MLVANLEDQVIINTQAQNRGHAVGSIDTQVALYGFAAVLRGMLVEVDGIGL